MWMPNSASRRSTASTTPDDAWSSTFDAVVRVARGVLLQDARQVLDADGRHARDRDVAALRPARLADLDQRGGQLGEQPARLRQEGAPDLGQRDRARGALHQLHAELRLEVLEAPREGGLRDVELARGLVEAALLRDREEGLQPEAVEIHACNLINASR